LIIKGKCVIYLISIKEITYGAAFGGRDITDEVLLATLQHYNITTLQHYNFAN